MTKPRSEGDNQAHIDAGADYLIKHFQRGQIKEWLATPGWFRPEAIPMFERAIEKLDAVEAEVKPQVNGGIKVAPDFEISQNRFLSPPNPSDGSTQRAI